MTIQASASVMIRAALSPSPRQAEAALVEFAALGAHVVRSSPLTPDQRRSLLADLERHGALARLLLADSVTCAGASVADQVRAASFHLVVAWSIYRRLLTSPTEAAR